MEKGDFTWDICDDGFGLTINFSKICENRGDFVEEVNRRQITQIFIDDRQHNGVDLVDLVRIVSNNCPSIKTWTLNLVPWQVYDAISHANPQSLAVCYMNKYLKRFKTEEDRNLYLKSFQQLLSAPSIKELELLIDIKTGDDYDMFKLLKCESLKVTIQKGSPYEISSVANVVCCNENLKELNFSCYGEAYDLERNSEAKMAFEEFLESFKMNSSIINLRMNCFPEKFVRKTISAILHRNIPITLWLSDLKRPKTLRQFEKLLDSQLLVGITLFFTKLSVFADRNLHSLKKLCITGRELIFPESVVFPNVKSLRLSDLHYNIEQLSAMFPNLEELKLESYKYLEIFETLLDASHGVPPKNAVSLKLLKVDCSTGRNDGNPKEKLRNMIKPVNDMFRTLQWKPEMTIIRYNRKEIFIQK